jgi:hypothetical protein
LNFQKTALEKEIERLSNQGGRSKSNDDEDALDSFMASIDTSLEQEKIDKRKTSLKEIEEEIAVSKLKT